jgi:hypothetical protein
LAEHEVGDVEPAHADLDLGLVRGVVRLPERRVLLPEALGSFASSILARVAFDGTVGGPELRHREVGEEQRLTRRRHDRDQRLERLRERRDAVGLELLRDRIDADAGVLDALEHRGRLVHALLEAWCRLPVVLVRDDRRGRHRVDGVGTDEGVDVVGVGDTRGSWSTVLAQSGRCKRAPFRASARSARPELLPERAYASLALAIAALPISCFIAPAGPVRSP